MGEVRRMSDSSIGLWSAGVVQFTGRPQLRVVSSMSDPTGGRGDIRVLVRFVGAVIEAFRRRLNTASGAVHSCPAADADKSAIVGVGE
jgi:hypothetical protein